MGRGEPRGNTFHDSPYSTGATVRRIDSLIVTSCKSAAYDIDTDGPKQEATMLCMYISQPVGSVKHSTAQHITAIAQQCLHTITELSDQHSERGPINRNRTCSLVEKWSDTKW
jgi:hypothetical protein